VTISQANFTVTKADGDQLVTYFLEYFMRTTSERLSAWEPFIGILLAEVGIGLFGVAEWDPMETGVRMPLRAAGFLFLAVGMFLIWKEPFRALMIGDETSPDGAACKTKVRILGRIDLNGHYLEAYEEEGDDLGRRFRLRSFPPISPESEAGFIRYLIREGFIEKRWPGLSTHIQKEAGWAFMF
jgi:hypothetical protein